MEHLFYYKDKDFFFHHTIDRAPNGFDCGMHAHEIYELFFLAQGKGKFVVEGNEYALSPGCLMLMRSGEAHHIITDSSCDYERLVLHFFPESLKSIDPCGKLTKAFDARPLGKKNQYILPREKSLFVRECLLRLCDRSRQGKTQRGIHSDILFALVEILNELRFQGNQNGGKTPPQKNDELISKILSYINENIFKSISVDSLCKEFAVSKSQLLRRFKKSTAATVWQYILEKRLIHAHLLIRNGKSAKEACFECGFNDYSSFFRAYKKKFSQKPSAWET